jgi:lipopolysaccharide transport system ATP-binding protein
MNDLAIRLDHLGKQYRIGLTQKSAFGHREMLHHQLLAVLRRWLPGGRNGRHGTNMIWALKDVSFEVKQGEAVGIIGRNGAGKSTLLKVLSRITDPTTGGADVYGRLSSLLEVGTGFHPELTGRENIYLNGAILGMRKVEIDRKFDEIVAFSEIEKFIDTAAKFYSTGMVVRLAFAVAAHLEPDILLVDEVLAVGDASFRKKCVGKMGEVARQGRTVLFVSHSLGILTNLCPRAILLTQGRVVRDGPAREVIAQYLAEGVEADGERVWTDPATAPGNERVRLHAVRIVSGGQSQGDVSIEEPVQIEIEFWNFQPKLELSTSIQLSDNLGVEVLASANFPSASLTRDEWFDKPYPAGLFRATCTVPGNFLNEGIYAIGVTIFNQINHVELTAREAIRFTVQDTGAMSGEWRGKWPGVVRPRLAWQTQFLHDNLPAAPAKPK